MKGGHLDRKNFFILTALLVLVFLLGLFTKEYLVVNPNRVITTIFLVCVILILFAYKLFQKHEYKLITEGIIVSLILFFAFLMFYAAPKTISDFEVDPDSVEYAISAYNLYKFGDFNLYLNKEVYHPRCPWGYPLLITPFYFLFGAEPSNAIYSSLFFSLGSVFLVYLIARKIFGKIVAAVAMVLVSTSPLIVEYSRLVMAEAVSIFFALLVILLILNLKNGKHLFFVGLLAGALVNIKLPNIILLPGFILFIFFRHNKKDYARAILFFVIGLFVLLLPLFYHNLVRFGSIFRSGLNYWQPSYFDEGKLFSMKYVLGNLRIYGLNFLGLDFREDYSMFYHLTVAMLIMIGVYKVVMDKNRWGIMVLKTTSVIILLLLLLYLPQPYPYLRYMILVLPLLIMFGAYGLVSTLKFKWQGWVSVFLALIILFNTIDLAYETLKESPNVEWRLPQTQWKFKVVNAADNNLETNAYLVSSLNGVYVTHYFVKSTERKYVPLSQNSQYINMGGVCKRRNECEPVNLFAASENTGRLANVIQQGIPVYVDDYSCFEDTGSCKKLAETFRADKLEFEGVIFYKLRL